MSHFLKTINPGAAEAANSGRVIEEKTTPVPREPIEASASATSSPQTPADQPVPLIPISLPAVSDGVLYFPRPGELRAGKGVHAAIVTAVHDDATLDLVIVYDADDFVGMSRVPARLNGEGMGWEPADYRIRQLEAAVQRLQQQLVGTLVLADGDSILGIIDEHEDRLVTIEGASPMASKAKATRKGKAKVPKTKGVAASPPT